VHVQALFASNPAYSSRLALEDKNTPTEEKVYVSETIKPYSNISILNLSEATSPYNNISTLQLMRLSSSVAIVIGLSEATKPYRNILTL
jgi:hypothetical protein